MIKLIVCDIDGTLLHGGAREIDPVIFREIRRLREKGILFCPASGRQYTSLRRLFAPVADELLYLCENGALLFGPGAPGPLLAKTAIEPDLAGALWEEIRRRSDCEVLASGEDMSYVCPADGGRVGPAVRTIGNHCTEVDRWEDIPEDVVKLSAYCIPAAQPVAEEMAPRWKDRFSVAVAGEQWVDFTVADKGTGVRLLCRTLGVELSEVMAFGDNYNDIPMLTAVGVPYLMENAAEALKARFPRRCRRVEEVLAVL